MQQSQVLFRILRHGLRRILLDPGRQIGDPAQGRLQVVRRHVGKLFELRIGPPQVRSVGLEDLKGLGHVAQFVVAGDSDLDIQVSLSDVSRGPDKLCHALGHVLEHEAPANVNGRDERRGCDDRKNDPPESNGVARFLR